MISVVCLKNRTVDEARVQGQKCRARTLLLKGLRRIGFAFSFSSLAAISAPVLDEAVRQAETAELVAAPVEAALSGYRGTGYVNLPARGGSATWANLDGGPGGGVNIQIRYQLAETATGDAPVTVNGVTRRVRFPKTGTNIWNTVTAFGRFLPGTNNNVALATDGTDIGVVDEIVVSQPAPVRIPARVYWGGYKGMSQLVGAGTSQWAWVQAHQDGLLLHGAYWGNPAMSPAPSNVAPELATLLAPYKQRHIYEAGFPGEFPRIDSKLGSDWAVDATQDVTQVLAWGFSQPDISTDFHMFAWGESMRYHPEWSHEDFFAALCGNWESYTGAVVSARTYGWFRQWTEKLAQAYPGIRVTACNSPVYFSWDDLRELGDGNNAYSSWVKLERHGANVEAFWSATGYSWKSLGVTTSTLPSAAIAGLAVSSKNNARLATAKFNSAQVCNFFFGDIGTPGRGGTLALGSNTFTLTSNGDHLDGTTNDTHFFVYREQSGDGAFVARVDSLVNNWSPSRADTAAGIVVRESLAAGARVASISLRNDGKAQFVVRTSAGGAVATIANPAAAVPSWLKLTRSGNGFAAWISTNGATYTQVGTTQTVAMAGGVKVGLFCDSSVYWEDAAAQFSDVSFLDTTASSASWTGLDIGAPGKAGSQTISSTITVNASGADIGGLSDQLRFVYKPLTNDGTVLAECMTFADKTSASTALDPLAKMGVMLRASTNANARHASVCFTPQYGIRQLARTADGASSVTGGVWGAGEAGIVPGLNSANRRTLAHYLTGNDYLAALRDAFPGAYKPNYAGFTTDSPYAGYMCWGGSESNADAQKHRQKIRNYEAWLQANGLEHQLIANSNVSGASGTQTERDAWDSDYADESLRSITLHQLEGGRPDRVIFESWYDGPFTLVPETKSGTYANLAMRGIKYLKGDDQTLDLAVKSATEPLFFGTNLHQAVPEGAQVRTWRATSTNAAQTFTLRLKNTGDVAALPVLQAYGSGGAGWSAEYFWGTTNVTALITSADGLALTDSALQGQELIASNTTVELSAQIAAQEPSAARSVLIRAFWNPQDPNLAVKDAVRLDLLPPNVGPVASSAYATASPGGSVDVDLLTLVSDSETPGAALWFAVTGATNGTAVLLADGHTVRFMAAAGYSGPATFSYAVRDACGDPRLLRHYAFEPPDTAADALATDAANRSDGTLAQSGGGSFAYVGTSPFACQAQSLRLVETNAGHDAELRTSLPSAEYDLTQSSWTLSVWFKRATRTSTDMVLYIGSGNGASGDGHELEVWCGANEDKVNLRYWDATNGLRASFGSSATVLTGAWHHAAVVWTAAGGGAGSLAFYADGAACGSTNLTAGFKQSSDLIFGGIASTASDPRALNGWLDDCALFAAALEPAEIARLAQMPVANSAGLASGASVTVNVDDSAGGLLARWPFDGTLADVTGNGWSLTAAGNAALTNSPVKQGALSLALDGSGDYAFAGPMPLGDVFTLSAWVFVPSNASNIQTVAANSGGGGSADGFRFYVNGYTSNPGDGKLVLETGNGTSGKAVASAAGAVAKDRWQHVAAVVSRASGTATLYRNGTAVASGAVRTDFTNGATLWLGGMGGTGFPFRSNLDDVRVYSRALTSNEVAGVVNSVNASPVISAITNQTLSVNTGTGLIGLAVSDEETAAQHLTLSASSSNTGLVQNAGVLLGGSGASRTVNVTPVSNRLGSALITLTLSDGARVTNGAFLVTVTGTQQETWRFDRFGTTANSGSSADAANPDNDAWNNAEEYVLGTDPLSASPGAELVISRMADSLLLSFFGRQASGAGYTGLTRYYDVESAPTLATGQWAGVAGRVNLAGSNQTVTVSVPRNSPLLFYRLQIRLQ